jgi:ABC-type sulfate transport system permease component
MLLSVFQILTDTIFLSGLGVVLLSTLITTIFAGGLGVALGYMIHKKEFLSHHILRFLRLGLWLPVYVFGDCQSGAFPSTMMVLC